MTGRTRSCRTSRNRPHPIKPMQAPRRARSWSRARSNPSTCRRRRTRLRGWCRRSRFSPIRIPGGAAFPASASPPPAPVQTSTAPTAPAGSIWPPAQNTAPAPAGGTPSAGPGATPAPTPKKVHTVIIRTDQMGSTTADASTAPETPSAAPAQAPVRTAPPRAAMQQGRPAPAPRAEANGPLSIVPNQGGAASPPARTRTALARPAEPSPGERAEPASSAGSGGYAVQVTSQRSEADAQAEFRTLRTKFPTQFGGREPIIRRADLGAKGVYYRALVGPFASADQAAGMCSSLKAAGGSCIVQRN